LDELLERQVYRLSYWRVAAEEINYRRFFDINSLAAIRVEVPEVFEAAHQLVLKMVARGEVTGLRIDHVDGLWNPRAYLERLQKHYSESTGAEGDRPLYLVVEKILGPDEWIPADWPCHGTTGYEFAADLIQLLVDAGAVELIDETYADFAEESSFEDMVYEKKLLVTRMVLGERDHPARAHARPAFREKPPLSRLYARSAHRSATRDDRLLPRIPHVC
jgi:(1->4)-alpha-D-glucan 1-alpha-D-glucosylmutase